MSDDFHRMPFDDSPNPYAAPQFGANADFASGEKRGRSCLALILGVPVIMAAAVFLVAAVFVAWEGPEPKNGVPPGPVEQLGFAFGAFLPAVLLFILGAWLLKSPKSS